MNWWENEPFKNYSKALKGLTGLTFMILGLTILNYGTKLETAVSSSLNRKIDSVESLEGLDLRILTITIFLSLVFFCRALIDSLYAWNILDSSLHSPYIGLILIVFTEFAPSIIITLLIKKKAAENLNLQLDTQDS